MSPTCVMSTDTNDPCCSAPKCTFDANLGRVPQPLPAFGQSALSYSVVSPNTGASQHNGYGKTVIPLFNTAFTPAPPTVDPGKMSAGGWYSKTYLVKSCGFINICGITTFWGYLG